MKMKGTQNPKLNIGVAIVTGTTRYIVRIRCSSNIWKITIDNSSTITDVTPSSNLPAAGTGMVPYVSITTLVTASKTVNFNKIQITSF